MTWLDDLRYDAIAPLVYSGHTAVEYWAKRDLLGEKTPHPKDVLWNLHTPTSILKKQNEDGSWTYPTHRTSDVMDYDQVETYRQLGFLVEMFGFTREHPSIEKAAKYIFSKQTLEGDIRGIYARQYSPNYTAALVELLVKAGYESDERIARAFAWLDGARQDGGGWALAIRTQGRKLDAIYQKNERIELDRSEPFSHFVTGVVLRAYAAHETYRQSPVATKATGLLVTRFFERDKYTDKGNRHDWTRFSFPFWQTDILSSLDIIGLIEPGLANHEKVLQAKQWFIAHQQPDGMFIGHLLKDRYHDLPLWYSYAICRAFRRLSGAGRNK